MAANKIIVTIVAASALGVSAAPQSAETWRIDSIDRIGGHAATVLGHPRVVPAPG